MSIEALHPRSAPAVQVAGADPHAALLVTGGSGQLATALEHAAAARHLILQRVGRPEFDFDDPATLSTMMAQTRPSLVVNAAAWTAVDLAESNAEAAAQANVHGPAELARLCAAAGVPLIHVSTDYVFDGAKGSPYLETDATSPTGVYGVTKLAGERAVLDANPRCIVLRTSWVYSATGRNFVRTMLAAANRTATLRVVCDQQGCPTSAEDLAKAILAVAGQVGQGWRDEFRGVTHAAGSGSTTWFGLATAVFEEASRHGRPVPVLTPISTAEYPTPARRPADSRLDCSRLERVFGVRMPAWRSSVAGVVDELLAREASAA